MARRNAPDKRKQHLLAGKVTCAHCGNLMTRGTVTRSTHGRYFCPNQGCGYAIPGKRRNSIGEKPLIEAVFLAMADKAAAVAAAMENEARRRDERSSNSPEVDRLQAKRRTYMALLADGDPVQGVLDELDRQICALMAAGQPAGEGGHLMELRAYCLDEQRKAALNQQMAKNRLRSMPPLWIGEGEEWGISSDEEAVATHLKQRWLKDAGRAADKGEAGITRQSWELLRDLLREAVVEGKRLVRVELNL